MIFFIFPAASEKRSMQNRTVSPSSEKRVKNLQENRAQVGAELKPAVDSECRGGGDEEKWRRAKEQEETAFFPVPHKSYSSQVPLD